MSDWPHNKPKIRKNTKNINFVPRDCKNRFRSVRFTPYGFIRKESSPSSRPCSASQHAYQLARLTKVPLQGGDVRENVRTWFSMPPKPIYTST